MKGKISKRLEKALSDPDARKDLRKSLVKDDGGSVTIEGMTYRVTKDKRIQANKK